eukprot:294339_1
MECHTINCPSIIRRNRRINCPLSQNVLDKIHCYYVHSIATQHAEESKYNKFVSHIEQIALSHKHTVNSNDCNIYGFGVLFQYIACTNESNESNEIVVTEKYCNFKQEVLQNGLEKFEYKLFLVEKCEILMKSDYMKNVLLVNENNIALNSKHILSVLLYCNFDEYQKKWSETYRRIPLNETNECMIRRHSYYYHSSCSLKELVENFGTNLAVNDSKNITFYHGISTEMLFIRTITQIYGPMSASTDINVALRFTTNKGLILQLKYAFSYYPISAKYFDCSYLSDFTEEKECLFLGGIPIMIISNIINVLNINENYKLYIKSLNRINSIFAGIPVTFDEEENDDESVTCIELLRKKLNDKGDEEEKYNIHPNYVVDLLDEYCSNLADICIPSWKHSFSCHPKRYQQCFGNDKLEFFDLLTMEKLFPNLRKIEYKNKGINKSVLDTIFSYLNEYFDNHNSNWMSCFIFYHKISNSSLLELNNNRKHQTNWIWEKTSNKTIIFRNKLKIKFLSEIKFNRNRIKQGIFTNTFINCDM